MYLCRQIISGMERTKIIRRRLNGQWTVMDSHFLKSLTGTARACSTRDKFHDFTVHYCPLSRYKQISVTPVTPVTQDFLKVSRVLRTRIMHPGATRIRLHGTRDKFTHYSVTGVTARLISVRQPLPSLQGEGLGVGSVTSLAALTISATTPSRHVNTCSLRNRVHK